MISKRRMAPWAFFKKKVEWWLMAGGITEQFSFAIEVTLGQWGEVSIFLQGKNHVLWKPGLMNYDGKKALLFAVNENGCSKGLALRLANGAIYTFYYDKAEREFYYFYQEDRYYLLVIPGDLHLQFKNYDFFWSHTNWRRNNVFVIGFNKKGEPIHFRTMGRRPINPCWKILDSQTLKPTSFVFGRIIYPVHRLSFFGWLTGIGVCYDKKAGYNISFSGRRYCLNNRDIRLLGVSNGDKVSLFIDHGQVTAVKANGKQIDFTVIYDQNWRVIYSTRRNPRSKMTAKEGAVIIVGLFHKKDNRGANYFHLNCRNHYLPRSREAHFSRTISVCLYDGRLLYWRYGKFGQIDREIINLMINFCELPPLKRQVYMLVRVMEKCLLFAQLSDEEIITAAKTGFYFFDLLNKKGLKKSEWRKLNQLLVRGAGCFYYRGISHTDKRLKDLTVLKRTIKKLAGYFSRL